jgi:hypothetical protein
MGVVLRRPSETAFEGWTVMYPEQQHVNLPGGEGDYPGLHRNLHPPPSSDYAVAVARPQLRIVQPPMVGNRQPLDGSMVSFAYVFLLTLTLINLPVVLRLTASA